jgi:cytochrome c oxidase assembly factor CtaG
MWKVSEAFLAFTIIALIIGVVLLLCYALKEEDERSDVESRNLHRASLFLLATVALGVLVLVFQRREAVHMVKNLL